MPRFPMLEYLQSFTWVMGVVVTIGAILLLVYPHQRNRIALVWIAMGLSQVVFSMFWAYPYALFYYFPDEVAYGLFTLTCGVVLATFDIMRMQNPRRILGASMILLGCLELVAFFDYYFKFQRTGQWMTMIDTALYAGFVGAAIATLSCGVLSLLKSAK